MSKATEFTKRKRPEICFERGDGITHKLGCYFRVTDAGELRIPPNIDLSASEALALADWIHDTFGENQNA